MEKYNLSNNKYSQSRIHNDSYNQTNLGFTYIIGITILIIYINTPS